MPSPVAVLRRVVTLRNCFLGLLSVSVLYTADKLLREGREDSSSSQLARLEGREGRRVQGATDREDTLLEERGEEVEVKKEVETKQKEEGWITGEVDIRLWIDLPNGEHADRRCLQEYGSFLTLLHCSASTASQSFLLRPTNTSTSSSRTFSLHLPNGLCLQPGDGGTKNLKNAVISSKTCSGQWLWTEEGQFQWQGPVPWQMEKVNCGQHEANTCADCPKDPQGKLVSPMDSWCNRDCYWDRTVGPQGTCRDKDPTAQHSPCPMCLTGVKENTPVRLQRCNANAVDEAQLVEMGDYTVKDGKKVLRPCSCSSPKCCDSEPREWRERQARARDRIMKETKMEVTKAVEEITREELIAVGEEPGRNYRRAVVFYMDQGKSGLQQLLWWLQAWRLIGLDSPEEAFDVVVMVHPDMSEKMPAACRRIKHDFTARFNGSGECFYKPYIGIQHRDPAYDKYMNSQECLVGPGTDFLGEYRVLLRADMDTFPTPKFSNFWPEGVLVDRHYSTNFNLRSIKNALKRVACEAGLTHHGWYNPGSTWYGAGRRVRHLAKLTVALNKFGRANLFGPGTQCRCPECTERPEICAWGQGPYPGVLLLYLQELAVNTVLTQSEWDSLPPGLFDQGVSSTTTTICGPALLHCFQHAELFSKLAFGVGKYEDMDMAQLDLTTPAGFAAYNALVANNQGKNGEVALAAMKKKIQSSSNLTEWCQKQKTR